MSDRRKTLRNRTRLGGVIAFNHRSCTLDCLVRDMSADGAKIIIESTVSLPGEFDIMIKHKGDSRRARMIWRDLTQVGIVFVSAEIGNVVSIEATRRIRALETERDSLVRRVAQLSAPA